MLPLCCQQLPAEPHRCTQNFCLSCVCRVCWPAGWVVDSWALNLTSVFPQDVCHRKKCTILRRVIDSWLGRKLHQIFSDLCILNTWKDDRCTCSIGELCVHNNDRQYQALENRDSTALQLQPFFNEDRDTTCGTGNRCVREVYGARASSKCCGVRTQPRQSPSVVGRGCCCLL